MVCDLGALLADEGVLAALGERGFHIARPPDASVAFADLRRLPELFPFRFTVSVDRLRGHPWFAVQRQGSGWDMVRLKDR